MKSNQSNATWKSNVFTQESGQGNWKLLGVRYEEAKVNYPIITSATTSLKMEATNPQILSGDTVQVSSPADGEKDVVVSITSTTTGGSVGSLNSQTLLFTGSSPPEATYFPSASKTYGGLFNGDGTKVYRFLLNGNAVAFSCATPYRPELGTTALGQFTFDSTIGIVKGRFSRDGTKFFGLTITSNVYVYDVTTPFDLTTLTNRITYDTTALLLASWTGRGYNSSYTNYQAYVVDICFNNDGTKVMLMRWYPGYYDSYTNLYASATLSSAYDLSTYTNVNGGTLNAYSSSSQYYFYSSFDMSSDGSMLYTQYYNNNGDTMQRAVQTLNTPWSAGSSAPYVSSSFYSGSRTYINTGSYSGSSTPYDMLAITRTNNGVHGFFTGTYWYGRITSGTDTLMPTATWNISSSSFTQAPTAVTTTPANKAAISYTTGPAAKLSLVGQPLALGKASTSTTMYLSNNVLSGTGLITTGSRVLVGTAEVTAGTVTETTGYFTATYGATVNAPVSTTSSTNKAAAITGEGKYINLYGLGNTTSYSTSWPFYMHCMISADGKTFYTNTTTADPTVANRVAGCVARYSLSVPFDFTTTTYVKSYLASTLFSSGGQYSTNYPGSCSQFSPDGTKFFYINGYSTGSLAYMNMRTCSTPFDLDTLSTAVTYLQIEANSHSFTITPDGKKLFYATGTTMSSLILNQRDFGTPWDLSSTNTTTTHGTKAGYPYGMTSSGNSTNGYYIYGRNSTDPTILVMNLSSTGTLSYSTSPIVNLRTGIQGGGSSPGGTTAGYGIVKVSPCGSKLLHFCPGENAIGMYNIPMDLFENRYTIDITSAGLSNPPNTGGIADPVYVSLGTATKTSSSVKNTYTYPDVAIDTAAIKLQVVGNTGAVVSKINADLYTE